MINIPKGTKDVLPEDSYKWHYVESKIKEVTEIFNLKEIRTPVFEHTELFLRGVGETTDIVNKEMYTFLDKGGRSITLKPEGTAGAARSYVENSLGEMPQPVKTYYITPVFRYEKPQNGRLREHHQFGIEVFGVDSPEADAEVILVAKTLFDKLGLKKLTLHLNSIGCKECRTKYNEKLKEYLRQNADKLCPTCRERMEKNPLRVLDCKVDACKVITKDAPRIQDYLCDDCKKHQDRLTEILTALGVDYVIDSNVVRGLDYYTKTVFEFISTDIGAQGTVCGGGRYNHLIEEVGGKPAAAAGFGMGIERLLITLENLGLLSEVKPEVPTVYVAPLGENAKNYTITLSHNLRLNGVSTETDLVGRSVKAQMKYANKIGAKFVIVLGENEINEQAVDVKDMQTGESEKVSLNEIVEYLVKKQTI